MPNIIPVYKKEIDDGLSELINSAEARTVLTYAKAIPTDVPLTNSELALAYRALGAEQDSFDLYPIYSVLVTVDWNKNEDVFDKCETWAARNTPVDKPFNVEHEPRKIIGHITSSRAVTNEFKLIPDNVAIDDLPDEYHLLTGAVIYKHLKSLDENLEKESAELIASIQRGEKYVSMEALFNNFDYAVVASDGSKEVVQRNADTAYLTKHLRAYGGSGVYNGRRVGRLLRGITFSGKGLVAKPANPKSIIINDVQGFTFSGVKSEMPNEDKTPQLEKQIAELSQANEELRTQLSKANEGQLQVKIDELTAKVTEQEASIADMTTKLAEVTAKANLVEGLEKAKAEAEQSLVKANEELNKFKLEALKANRTTSLVDKGVEKARAEEIVNKFINLNDEQFVEIVNVQAELIVAKQAKPVEPVVVPEPEVDPKGEQVAQAGVVEEVVPEVTPALNSNVTPETQIEAARASLSEFLGNLMANKK